ncbi:MAG: type II toxin-antitoxin system Phd/YefM family antitoxin [Candidatus Sumerlaeaceae bacterium]
METTYSAARSNLKSLMDQVSDTKEPIIIRRRGNRDVALVALDELEGLLETAHLLRSPKNAERLQRALKRARSRTLKPAPLEKLKRDLGIEKK